MQQHFSSILSNLRHMIAAKYSYAKTVTAKDDISEVFIFISSNQRENLTQDEAVNMISSPGHNMLRFLVSGYAELGGKKVDLLDTIGEWSDGIENSLLAIFNEGIDVETAKTYAALAGQAANQKSVLIFFVSNSQAKDLLLSLITSSNHNLSGLRDLIRSSGIEYSTIINQGNTIGINSYEILTCCSGESCRLPFSSLARSLKVEETLIGERSGFREFLGADTRREANDGFERQADQHGRRNRKLVKSMRKMNKAQSQALETSTPQEKALLDFPLLSERSKMILDRIFGVSNFNEDQYLDLLINSEDSDVDTGE
jgi:hypothetical protein